MVILPSSTSLCTAALALSGSMDGVNLRLCLSVGLCIAVRAQGQLQPCSQLASNARDRLHHTQQHLAGDRVL